LSLQFGATARFRRKDSEQKAAKIAQRIAPV
jgi:hypothetical protein